MLANGILQIFFLLETYKKYIYYSSQWSNEWYWTFVNSLTLFALPFPRKHTNLSFYSRTDSKSAAYICQKNVNEADLHLIIGKATRQDLH